MLWIFAGSNPEVGKVLQLRAVAFHPGAAEHLHAAPKLHHVGGGKFRPEASIARGDSSRKGVLTRQYVTLLSDGGDKVSGMTRLPTTAFRAHSGLFSYRK